MCSSCRCTNRRVAQNVFFNIILKNIHDKEHPDEADEDEGYESGTEEILD